jgi:gas vesicle structural protein
VAPLQLRAARPGGPVNDTPARPLEQQVTLLELVDRVLNKGVVVSGDITLSVADVDLVYVGLRVLLASVATIEEQLDSGAR